MAIWEDKIFSVGDRVLTEIGHGKITSLRFDGRGELLVTVYLDDPSQTPTGFYLTRDFEIRRA